jgi:NAD(P)-dependent dehydrogenase (short-subunit alcohol dehydrogenase family)
MAGAVQDKAILVTGGGSGIGRATSLRLAKEGAKIMIADYVPEGAEKTVAMIKEAAALRAVSPPTSRSRNRSK